MAPPELAAYLQGVADGSIPRPTAEEMGLNLPSAELRRAAVKKNQSAQSREQ
jgi:hypothetical protein